MRTEHPLKGSFLRIGASRPTKDGQQRPKKYFYHLHKNRFFNPVSSHNLPSYYSIFGERSIQPHPPDASKTKDLHTIRGDAPGQSEKHAHDPPPGTIPKDGRPSFAPPPQTKGCRPPHRKPHLSKSRLPHWNRDYDRNCTIRPRATKPNRARRKSPDANGPLSPDGPPAPADAP